MANKVVQDVVVAPDENWSAVLTPGQVLRIVDLEGKQAVDFLCYNADDPADRYNAADTMKYNKNAYLGAGHGIYSVRATKLFTIVADSMGGGHDTVGGCCSAASNMFRYKVRTPRAATLTSSAPSLGTAWARRTSWPTSTSS